MNAPHILYADSEPQDAPILWRRKSVQYNQLRYPEYAFVAHRFPYVEDAMAAYRFRLTKEEVPVILDVLATEYGLPERVNGEPRVTLNWLKRGSTSNAHCTQRIINLKAAAPQGEIDFHRRAGTNPNLISGGWCQLHVLLHEFAHLISGHDKRPGWKGNSCTTDFERYDYRSGGYVYVPGRFIRSKTAHGPSFVKALVDVFDTMRGLTDAY